VRARLLRRKCRTRWTSRIMIRGSAGRSPSRKPEPSLDPAIRFLKGSIVSGISREAI